jgi:hypothetical protein
VEVVKNGGKLFHLALEVKLLVVVLDKWMEMV